MIAQMEEIMLARIFRGERGVKAMEAGLMAALVGLATLIAVVSITYS